MFQDYNKPRTRSLQESHHHLINRTHIPGGPSVSSGQPKSKCSKGAPSHPLCPLCMLHLLHLVVRRSSSNTGVVDLPGPCLLSYSCLANTNYKIYSTPAHGQPVSESIPTCGNPTHLLLCFLIVYAVLLVSSVRVSFRSLSF